MKKRLLLPLIGLITFNASASADEHIPVRVQPLSDLLQAQTFSAPATVKAFNQPQLAAEVTGQILELPVRIGDTVAKGQLIAKLDCRVHKARERTANAALTRSRSQRSFAEAQLKRANNLKRKNSISDELVDQRRTDLAAANADLRSQQAQLELAKLDVERCQIHAPFDALVSERSGNEGSLATPGTPLATLVQLNQLEVSAKLREREVQAFADATQIHFSYQNSDYPLRLRALPPLVDERTRTREARLAFDQQSAPVGAAGRLTWISNQQQIPADLLIRRAGQLGVFIAKQGKAHFYQLKDAREGQAAAIHLPPSTLIITEGRQRLQHAEDIKVQEPQQ